VGHTDYFAIPQVNIAEVVWLHGEEVFQELELVDNQEVYWLRGQLLPILRLSTILGVKRTRVDPSSGTLVEERRAEQSDQRRGRDVPDEEKRSGPVERRASGDNDANIVVLKLAHERFGLLVDRIIDTQEIVAKALHDQLKSAAMFAGTTVLGDGRIAMILDVAALVKVGALRPTKPELAVRRSSSSRRTTLATSGSDDRQTVLLFDIGGPETFAVPLRLITRVEEIGAGHIKVAKGREFLDFRGEVIPLIRMEQAVPAFGATYPDDLLYVIIPRSTRPIGIAASRVVDTIDVECDIDSQTIAEKGIVGTALVEGTLALFPDLFEIIDLVEPGWFREDRLARQVGPRVLFLEDSAFYAALLAPVMRSAGMEVTHASNGQEGLERLAEGAYDLVVSDLDMPVMDGFEFAQRCRKRPELRGMHMLAVSARGDRAVEAEATESGFDEFLSKLDQEGLLERLRSLATRAE